MQTCFFHSNKICALPYSSRLLLSGRSEDNLPRVEEASWNEPALKRRVLCGIDSDHATPMSVLSGMSNENATRRLYLRTGYSACVQATMLFSDMSVIWP